MKKNELFKTMLCEKIQKEGKLGTIEEKNLAKLKSWMRKNYEQFLQVLVNLTDSSEAGVQIPAINIFLQLLARETRIQRNNNIAVEFPKKWFFSAIEKISSSENFNDGVSQALKQLYCHYDDVKYHLMLAVKFKLYYFCNFQFFNFTFLRNVLEMFEKKGGKSSDGKEILLDNVYEILSIVEFSSEMGDEHEWRCKVVVKADLEKERKERSSLRKTKKSKKEKEEEEIFIADLTDKKTAKKLAGVQERKGEDGDSEKTELENIFLVESHKKLFGECWLRLLRMPLSGETFKKILLLLDEKVIPHMSKPQTLIDFLKNAYELGGTISILSLKSLFLLITKYGL